ncbi:MAG TPA: PA0069 family radical SAM protein [Gammaproteobacteria bacterium]
MARRTGEPVKGRGSASAPDGRYLDWRREFADDGWWNEEPESRLPTTVTVEHPKTVISRNQSPDIPFEASINPYRGCEHACPYCYARPTHAYLDLSPGLDFETKLFAKPDAPAILRRELGEKGYRCTPIALGTNTDPYQPIEREWRITRGIIEVLAAHDHPLTIVTKSGLVVRDIDLLAPMAGKNLVWAALSITTLQGDLANRMEPRAAAPAKRLATLRRLSEAGIPVGVMFAPVIPFLNDHELESVLEQAAEAGARWAGYVVVRLPHEIKDLFREWLTLHEPLKAERIMNTIRDLRGGRDNDPEFFSRQRGSGPFAGLIRSRFEKCCERLNLNRESKDLRTDLFRPPRPDTPQFDLF